MGRLLLLIFLNLSLNAHAGVACVDSLVAPAASVRANFAVLRARLAELPRLNAALQNPKLEIRYASKRLGQSDISFSFTWLGRKRLTVRAAPNTDQALWQLAQALYRSEVESPLFSRASWLSDQPYTGAIDSDAALEYFTQVMPREWRDERLPRIHALDVEMQTLFERLPGLKSPAPKRTGEKALLFRYYFRHLRRLARVTIVLQALMWAPSLPALPADVENMVTHFEQQQELTQQRAEQITRLQSEIRRLQAYPGADASVLTNLKTQLQQLER